MTPEMLNRFREKLLSCPGVVHDWNSGWATAMAGNFYPVKQPITVPLHWPPPVGTPIAEMETAKWLKPEIVTASICTRWQDAANTGIRDTYEQYVALAADKIQRKIDRVMYATGLKDTTA